MRHGFFRFILALSLIVFGVILILENIGIAPLNMRHAWFIVYPIVFILYGLISIVNRLRYKGGSWVFGSFIFIFGSLLLLDRFDWISFKFMDVFKLWPLLIIYLGILFFKSPNKMVIYNDKGKKSHSIKKSGLSVGSYEYKQENWKVQPMYLSNLAGDFYFDFTKAFIPEKETAITISTLAGDVHILMPENVDFRVEASVKAGDIDIIGQSAEGMNRSLTYETEHYNQAVRRLNFTLKLKAGSIRIDRIGGNDDV